MYSDELMKMNEDKNCAEEQGIQISGTTDYSSSVEDVAQSTQCTESSSDIISEAWSLCCNTNESNIPTNEAPFHGRDDENTEKSNGKERSIDIFASSINYNQPQTNSLSTVDVNSSNFKGCNIIGLLPNKIDFSEISPKSHPSKDSISKMDDNSVHSATENDERLIAAKGQNNCKSINKELETQFSVPKSHDAPFLNIPTSSIDKSICISITNNQQKSGTNQFNSEEALTNKKLSDNLQGESSDIVHKIDNIENAPDIFMESNDILPKYASSCQSATSESAISDTNHEEQNKLNTDDVEKESEEDQHENTNKIFENAEMSELSNQVQDKSTTDQILVSKASCPTTPESSERPQRKRKLPVKLSDKSIIKDAKETAIVINEHKKVKSVRAKPSELQNIESNNDHNNDDKSESEKLKLKKLEEFQRLYNFRKQKDDDIIKDTSCTFSLKDIGICLNAKGEVTLSMPDSIKDMVAKGGSVNINFDVDCLDSENCLKFKVTEDSDAISCALENKTECNVASTLSEPSQSNYEVEKLPKMVPIYIKEEPMVVDLERESPMSHDNIPEISSLCKSLDSELKKGNPQEYLIPQSKKQEEKSDSSVQVDLIKNLPRDNIDNSFLNKNTACGFLSYPQFSHVSGSSLASVHKVSHNTVIVIQGGSHCSYLLPFLCLNDKDIKEARWVLAIRSILTF